MAKKKDGKSKMMRVSPIFQKKVKRIHLRVNLAAPKRKITLVDVTHRIIIDERGMTKRIIEDTNNRRKRKGKYVY